MINYEIDHTPVKRINKKKVKIKQTIILIFSLIVLILISFAQVFPFYLKLVDALHGLEFIPEYDKIYFLPKMFSPENFLTAIERGDLYVGLINSLLHTLLFTTISLIVVMVMGYVLGKLEFKGKKMVSIMLLATMMVPGEVLMIPNYLLVQKLGWTNSLTGIILPGVVNIFGIFLVSQFMNTIPNSILESAELDGASELSKIFKIIIPMSKPIIITYVILTFTSTWNEYLWPMIVIKDPNAFTLQLKMYQFYPQFGGAADGFVRSAGMILITLPIIVMYFTFQRYFLEQENIAGIK